MTPILVRPVREQLEHDRVIRLLQSRWRRKYLVTINLGSETTAGIPCGESVLYPDVVLASNDRGHKPEVVIEVETGESVNNLEAMAEWARLAKIRAAFHLFVPTGSVDAARRLCLDHDIPVAEIWTYHPVGDQMRFTMVHKAQTPASARAAARARKAARKPAAAAARKTAPRKPAPAAPRRATARKAPARKAVAPARKPSARTPAVPAAKATSRRASRPAAAGRAHAGKSSERSSHDGRRRK